MQTGDELMNRWYVLAFGTRAILVIIGSGKTQCLKAIAQVVSSEFAQVVQMQTKMRRTSGRNIHMYKICIDD